MQSGAAGAGLVGADQAQAFALRQAGEVQVGAAQDSQHRGVRLHALHGARTVRRQDGRHGGERVVALIDEPVAGAGQQRPDKRVLQKKLRR